MTRTGGRARVLWRAFACATLASTLAACGGGGGGVFTPPVGSGGGTPPTESAWLLAEFVASDVNNQYVRVWDPDRPDVAVQNVRLMQGNGIVWTSSHLVYSDARSYDAATRSVTTLGHAKVFYDNDGKLYSIDLRGGQSHAPVQVSSAVDVFLPASATPMNAAGDDAWVDAQGGSHHWAIRTSMGATDAPVSVLQVLAPMRDAATGLPQYFFATLGSQSGIHVTPTTFQVFDATFTPVASALVASMSGTDGWVGADPAQAGFGYLRISSQLRAIHWSATALSVDNANLYHFTSFGTIASAADAQSLYFNDGSTLVGVSDGVARALGALSMLPSLLVDVGDWVAAAEIMAASSTQTLTQVETLRKSDGRRTLVEAATTQLALLGSTAQGLVVGGASEAGNGALLVTGDAATRTLLGASAQTIGVVRSASTRVDQLAAPLAVIECVAGSTDGFCAAGALTQVSLANGITSLGVQAAAAPWMRGDAIAGLPVSLSGQTFLGTTAGFGDGETSRRDAWQFTPATAGSLTRITSNVP
jgi:hypothetical protein